jgi:gliding motility-associated-like protein
MIQFNQEIDMKNLNFLPAILLKKVFFLFAFVLSSFIGLIGQNLTINISPTNPTCHGFTNGSAIANVINGTGNITYSWSNGQTTQTAFSLAAGVFTVTATDATGKTGTGSVTITQPAPYNLVVAATEATCDVSKDGTAYIREDLSTGGVAPFSYQWQDGQTFVVAYNLKHGPFNVTATDSRGCQAVATANVGLAPEGVWIMGMPMDISCNGNKDGSISVSAMLGIPPYTYKWNTGDTTKEIKNLGAGTYTVTVTDQSGCFNTYTHIIVEPKVIDAVISVTPSACTSPTGAIFVNPNGGTLPYEVKWPDGRIGFYFDNLAPGTYNITISDVNKCTVVKTVTIIDKNFILADLIATPESCAGANDGTATLNIRAGRPPFTTLWSTGQSSNIQSNLSPGLISVTVTDVEGCQRVVTATVNTGTVLASSFTNAFANCENNTSVNLNLTAAGAPSNTYTWTVNGLPYTGQNISVPVTVSPASVVLNVTAVNGCKGSSTQNVPFSFLNVTLPGDKTLCQNETGTLSVTNNNPSDPITITWINNNGLIIGSGNTVNINSANPATGTVTVRVTNAAGCSTEKTVNLNITPAGTAVSPNDITIRQDCNSNSVVLTGPISLETNYTWTLNGVPQTGNPVTIPFPNTGPQTVVLVPKVGCLNPVNIPVDVRPVPVVDFDIQTGPCFDSNTVKLIDRSIPPVNINKWNWTVGTQTSSQQNPTFNFTQAGNLNAELIVSYNNGCVYKKDKPLNVEILSLIVQDKRTVCEGRSVQLNPGGGPNNLTYRWSPATGLSDPNIANPSASPTSTTTYTLTVTNPSVAGCSTTRPVEVTIPPVIALSTPADITLCEDKDVVLNATATGTGTNLQWATDPAFSNVVGTGNSYTAKNPGRPSVYFIRATDQFGCIKEGSVRVGNFGISLTLDGSNSVCAGVNGTINATPSNLTDQITYTWSPVSTIVSGNGTATIQVNPTETSTYMLDIVNQFGCRAMKMYTLNVTNLQNTLNPINDTIRIYEGRDRIIDKLPAEYSNYQITWDPVVGLSNPNIVNPVILNPADNQVYNYTLTDDKGCTARGSIRVSLITSCEEPYIFVPNAFTPNDDGRNDDFEIKGFNIDEFNIAIYNRWGEKVFESNNVRNRWNGKHRDNLVHPDVYGYFLRIRCYNGKDYFKKGNVSVLK